MSEMDTGAINDSSQKQFPIAAGYALTDYCAQGQTIPTVIVDLITPSKVMAIKECTPSVTMQGADSGFT